MRWRPALTPVESADRVGEDLGQGAFRKTLAKLLLKRAVDLLKGGLDAASDRAVPVRRRGMQGENRRVLDGIVDVEQGDRPGPPGERPPRVRAPVASHQPAPSKQAEEAADHYGTGVDTRGNVL